MRTLALLCTLGAGCLLLEPEDGALKCDPSGACPPDYSCNKEHRCTRSGDSSAVGPDGEPAKADIVTIGDLACGPCAFANASALCSSGVCQLDSCNPGFDNCDQDKVESNGCEAALATDELNCGMCGRACASGERCLSSKCVATLATVSAQVTELVEYGSEIFYGDGDVRAVPKTGGASRVLAGGQNPILLASSAMHLYWFAADASGYVARRIGFAAGALVETVSPPQSERPTAMVVTTELLYFGNALGEIWSQPASGSTPPTLFYNYTAPIVGISADTPFIYFTGPQYSYKRSKNGGAATLLHNFLESRRLVVTASNTYLATKNRIVRWPNQTTSNWSYAVPMQSGPVTSVTHDGTELCYTAGTELGCDMLVKVAGVPGASRLTVDYANYFLVEVNGPNAAILRVPR